MSNVEIYNRTRADIDVEAVRRFTAGVLDATRDYRDAEVSVNFVGDRRIQQLNETWRGRGRPTDVLSFPIDEEPGAGPVVLGDIVIAPRQAAEDAREEGVGFDEKVRELVLHSLLHLMGYDHETTAGAKRMARRRRDLLKKAGRG